MRSSSLDRLKGLRAKRRDNHTGSNPRHSAARSHEQNDRYNQEFEKAWEEMEGMKIGSRPSQPVTEPRRTPTTASRELVCASLPSKQPAATLPPCFVDHLPASWLAGPSNPSGNRIDLSERPLLCSSSNWEKREVVIGGSDHALYVVHADSAKHRTLYTKSSGHSEWVTCVAYTPHGHIVSGGMDSRICLWKNGSTRCLNLMGHSGSISQLATVEEIVFSASYDKSVRIWNSNTGREVCCFVGHKAPVLELKVSLHGTAVSGDRGGSLILWDSNTTDVAWRMKNVHAGHVTALEWAENMILSGGQEGCLRVWDTRSKTHVAKHTIHATEVKGTGAVNKIIFGGSASKNTVVTSGADKSVKVLDLRSNFAPLGEIDVSDFPYELCVIDDLALCGCGDGSLYVVDINTVDVKYCLGANQAAVRTIDACRNRLVCGGDDGCVLVYNFQ